MLAFGALELRRSNCQWWQHTRPSGLGEHSSWATCSRQPSPGEVLGTRTVLIQKFYVSLRAGFWKFDRDLSKDAGKSIAQGNAPASYQLPEAGARPNPWSRQESPSNLEWRLLGRSPIRIKALWDWQLCVWNQAAAEETRYSTANKTLKEPEKNPSI